MIAELIPKATGPMRDEMRLALADREHLIEQRAATLAADAVARQLLWVRTIGPAPHARGRHDEWMGEVRVIAAYRDHYAITDDTPLGRSPASARQRADAATAQAALRHARNIVHIAERGHPDSQRRHILRDPHRL